MDPELAQLLDRDRHRRPAHARRDGRDRDSEEAACERAVLAAEGDLARVIQILGDQRRATRIARHQHVLANLALREADVVLLLWCYHRSEV